MESIALICIFLHIRLQPMFGNRESCSNLTERKTEVTVPPYVPDPFNFDFYFSFQGFHFMSRGDLAGIKDPKYPFVTKPRLGTIHHLHHHYDSNGFRPAVVCSRWAALTT